MSYTKTTLITGIVTCIFYLLTMFFLNKVMADDFIVLPDQHSNCTSPPPGTWGLTSDNNIEFCFIINNKKVCSELPKKQMLELLIGKQTKKLNI